MALSNELISQFAKVVKDDAPVSTESTVYGTVVEYEGSKYVKIDGSDLLTPISSTTNIVADERVTIMIKDHSAIVTGNMSSPAARTHEVEVIGDKVSEFDTIIADKVDTVELVAVNGRIDNLETDNLVVKDTLTAVNASIGNLEADNVTINQKLTANETSIGTLEADYVTVNEKLVAAEADIDKLNTDKLSATDADLKYANIDFANIGEAAMEYFYATSGLIKDVTVGDGTITGNLVGVTISGDLIEGNTVVAEKLVIKGEDGLYYKLNTDGMTVETEQTDYNSINGTVIKAKSITATKISVSDLVAFDATIGGFNITDNSIYSGVKESIDNTTRGIYMDNDGQMVFGDADNFIKFYKDSDGSYKLDISAATIKLGGSGKNIEETITEIQTTAGNSIQEVDVLYYLSDSNTILSGGSWNTVAPEWVDGKYMWSRVRTKLGTGSYVYSSPTCIAGATGATGPEGAKGDKGDTGAKGDAGSDGVGVSKITNYYLATDLSSGVTTSTSGWTSSVQSVTSSKKYLWNYEVVTYTNNTTTSTSPCIIGAYGDTGSSGATGATGNGIKSITEKYAVSTSNTTAPTTWYDTIQTMTSTNKYLWNYEIITYTNGDTSETIKRVIGVYGDTGAKGDKGDTGAKGDAGSDGADGIGVSSVEEEYYLSSSKTELVDGSWGTTAPTWSSGMYIWYRSKITYTNDVIEYTTAYCDSAWEAVNEVEEDIADAKSTADGNSMRISDAQLVIDQLQSTISSLVTGQNGESLMTQTDTGWTFSIKNILDTLNTATADIDDLNADLTDTNSVIDAMNKSIEDLGEYTDYIKFGTDNGKPCIILGETDSIFKVLITNTDIRFMEGSAIPASISNQTLQIGKATISDELTQGGFTWMARANGNYGLRWKGE